MEPLPAYVRRLYLLGFIALFLSILPVVIFYADGWRYKDGYGFVRTGGIFIAVPYPEANVFVNGVHIGQSGFLDRSFYIADLAPSAYIIHVEREGFHPWDRLLVVEEQLVTDSQTLLIPQDIEVTRIAATSTATTTRIVSAATLTRYQTIFATSTAASSTVPTDESDGVGLFIVKGHLAARWLQENAFPPSHFCVRPSACSLQVVLEDAQSVTRAYFFGGGVVYLTRDGKVYFTEVDVREEPVTALLYAARGADIRVIDDSLIIKVGNALSEVEL